MVHHYQEEESERPLDDNVKFNCQIEPPHAEAPLPPEPDVPPPPKPAPNCCPMPPVSSELVEALPTVLVAIGVAYLVGMATGAFIFSPSLE